MLTRRMLATNILPDEVLTLILRVHSVYIKIITTVKQNENGLILRAFR